MSKRTRVLASDRVCPLCSSDVTWRSRADAFKSDGILTCRNRLSCQWRGRFFLSYLRQEGTKTKKEAAIDGFRTHFEFQQDWSIAYSRFEEFLIRDNPRADPTELERKLAERDIERVSRLVFLQEVLLTTSLPSDVQLEALLQEVRFQFPDRPYPQQIIRRS